MFTLCLYSTSHEKQWLKTPTNSTAPSPALSNVWSSINFQRADELIDVSRGFGSDDDVDTDGVDDIMLPVEATLQRNSSINMQLKMRKSLEHD